MNSMISMPCVGPIDEGEIHTPRAPQLHLAEHPLARAFGLHKGTSYEVQTRNGWRRWRGSRPAPRRWAAAVAGITGGTGLAISGLREAQLIVLDLDAGHDVDRRRMGSVPVPVGCELSVALRLDTKAARMRHHVARQVREPLERLRQTFPGLPFLVQGTPHGVHVVIKTAPRDVAVLQSIGRALLLRIGAVPDPNAGGLMLGAGLDSFGVEAFPMADGRMCRSPGTGRVRLLNEALTDFANAKRPGDAHDLLALAPAAPELLDELARQGGAATTADDLETDAAPWTGSSEVGKLRGKAFAKELVAQYEHGIPRGQSWSASRRWAFAFVVCAGLSVADAVAAFRRLIELPQHQARKCRDARKRPELVASFRRNAKRYAAGIRPGELVVGKMRNKRLLAIISELKRGSTPTLNPVRAKLEAAKRERAERASKAVKARYTRHDLGKETPCHSAAGCAAAPTP